ncbi:hypothetical protein REPUB_Repub12eG0037100 [Reevesia pubescens]
MKTGSIRFFPMFSVASLLLILFCTSLSRAALPETKTNTTTYDETIAEYIEGEEEVFLGRSEISQRILAGYPPKYISYRGLEKPPACNANIYGNCIKSIAQHFNLAKVYSVVELSLTSIFFLCESDKMDPARVP